MNSNNENRINDVNEPLSSKKSRYIIAIVFSALMLLFLIGFIPRLLNWRSLVQEAGLSNPLIVKTMEVRSDKNPVELILPSSTQAIRITPIWARINGYIKDFYVDIGDHVEKDQLLAEISTPEIDHQLEEAQANLATATAKLEIANISSSRWENAYATDVEAVSTLEVETRKSTSQAEAAEVQAAQANVDRLKKILGFNKLYAPFSGTIIERNIDIGTLITAGSEGNLQKIYQLAKTDVIRVFASVPQTYFRSIKVGGETEVRIREFPERIFKGIIARTARALDPVARTLLTEIHVDNRDEILITGLYADVAFSLIPQTAYYVIPTTSLIILEGHPHVAVVDQKNIVHLERVQIGRDFGRTIEIISGLKENDKIVTNPNEKIVEGAHVILN